MVTIEQVKAAQRTAPLADATKALQREYEAQRSAARREARAAEWRAEQAAAAQQRSALLAHINSLRLCNAAQLADQGIKLVAMTHKTAAYYGMAPKLAGGWVAVRLTFGSRQLYAALIPETWTEGGSLSADALRATWLAIAIDNEDLSDILQLLTTLAMPSDLEVPLTTEDFATA